jgi:hypothetical protein
MMPVSENGYPIITAPAPEPPRRGPTDAPGEPPREDPRIRKGPIEDPPAQRPPSDLPQDPVIRDPPAPGHKPGEVIKV